MADLGLCFGEDDEEQLEQEDKALSYLVLSNEHDDAFDPVDTEDLLAQMSADSLLSHEMGLDEDTDVVRLLAEPNLSAVEKAQLLSQSQYDFHRKPLDLDDFSEDYEVNGILEDDQKSYPPPPLSHDALTPVFLNLLLDQNAGIAHQTRLAIDSVAQNIPDEVLESEILNGVISGLEKLYTPEAQGDNEQEDYDRFNKCGQDLYSSNRDEQDGEAELGKMLVVVLLTAMSSLLGPERCTQIVVPKLEMFTNNSQFYVRKEIVMALGALCKVVNQDVVVNRLLPMYDVFVQDDTWHIRRACCTILASFIGSLPNEMKATKVEEIYNIFSVDVSRSVRNSIMEVLGEVIAGFERDNVPESLLDHFLDMGRQPVNEHERAVMCAFSFPAVVLTAGPSKWELMKPIYMRLAGTFRSPIRRSLACSLHEVARILGPEIADRDLAIAFADCLFAEEEVKEGVLRHVVEFISCLSPKYRSDAMNDLLRSWAELERSSNWRLRDSLVGQLPALCEIADGDDLLQVLLPLSIKACTDGVSTIRESGVMAFPALWGSSERVGTVTRPKATCDAPGLDFLPLCDDEYDVDTEKPLRASRILFDQRDHDVEDVEDVEMEDISGDFTNDFNEKSEPSSLGLMSEGATSPSMESLIQPTTTIKEQVVSQVVEFAVNGGFRSRVVAVQIIQSLLDHGISISEFEEHFLPILADQLANDTVANVRIWVARVVNWIIESEYYGDSVDSPRLSDVLSKLQQDPDRDVRIYSGGSEELPEKTKMAKKNDVSTKEDGSVSKETPTIMLTTTTISVFHQNPKNGQPSVMEEEEVNGAAVQLEFDGCDSDDDDDDGEGDEDDDEEDDDENKDEDFISKDQPGYSDNHQSEEAVEPDNVSNVFAAEDAIELSENIKPFESDESPASLAKYETANNGCQIGDMADQKYLEEEIEEEVADRVVPYSALTASDNNSLDVEMKDSAEEEVSTEVNSRTQEPEKKPEFDLQSELNGPSTTAFPPLTPTGPFLAAMRSPPTPKPLSYAASVKKGDDAKAKALLNSPHTITSFTQANIPEPQLPSVKAIAATTVEEHIQRAVNVKLSAAFGKHVTAVNSSSNSKGKPLLTESSFPSMSSSSTLSLSNLRSPTSSPVPSSASLPTSTMPSSPLPFSYASVVASGAAVAARAFSPPLSSSIGATSATLTF
ncbi:Serine/threonine-protein phosphatase 4 regulatory subunit 1 [Mortierella sp. AM989]|nr:Serine/threonine-protein phosphatase 4 regulatory subunit 1 [Mortierella sp. AM989]